MDVINTFRGSRPLAQYRRACPHEHLLIDLTHEAVEPKTQEECKLFYSPVEMENLGTLRRNPYIIRDNLILDDADTAIREMTFLEKHGVDLFLDLTTVGLGRDMEKLQKISAGMKADLVIGTGFFVHDALDDRTQEMTQEQMEEFMLREIEVGIGDTGIRAGVIGEVGVSEKIYPVERRSLLASAAVHRKTGLPVYLHTFPWSRAGLEAAQLLMDNGVAPHKICICHVDVTFDHAYLTEMLRTGVYVEFDNFGKEFYFEAQDGAFAGGPFETDLARVLMLKRLVAEGWGRQLLMANDVCLKASLRKYGGWGYDHIYENMIPMMRREGLTPGEISLIMDENPLRFLKGTAL